MSNQQLNHTVNYLRAIYGDKAKNLKPKKRLPVWLYPTTAERRYEKQLLNYVDKLGNTLLDSLLPFLPGIKDLQNYTLPEELRSDDWADELERIIESTTLNYSITTANQLNKSQLAGVIANDVDLWNNKEWQKQLRAAFGVNIFLNEPFLFSEFKTFVNTNVNLITKLEGTLLTDTIDIVQRNFAAGASVNTISKEIQKRIGKSKSDATRIAVDQVGKLNGQLTKYRQTNLGLTHYFWKNSRDKRVRGNPTGKYPNAEFNHWTRENKRFAWSDSENPPDGIPGWPVRCRCFGKPDFTPVYEGLSA